MPERKIRYKAFIHYVEAPNPINPSGDNILVEKIAYRGQTVDMREQDAARGDALGAFYTEDDLATRTATSATGEQEMEEVAIEDMSDAELLEWIREDKPTVQEVVNAADGNVELAQRLLAAENAATGNDPRAGVVKGLETVIARANQ